MSVERKLAEGMGYEYCKLFPRARDAIRQLLIVEIGDIAIPSNCCEVLRDATEGRNIIDVVDPLTGLAEESGVHLYGYRNFNYIGMLSIDPLMTGWFCEPATSHTIISFGRSKTIDINGGGAFLTNDERLLAELHGYFPAGLRDQLEREINDLYNSVRYRRKRVAWWDRHLGDSLTRIPAEQVIPWRVMRRAQFKRREIITALRNGGFDVGTNYPHLRGITAPAALSWGSSVLNFWTTEEYDEQRIKEACELIKRAVNA